VKITGAGQYPKSRPWKVNPHGTRSVEQAIELLQKWGVTVPDDVLIVSDDEYSIDDPHVDACYFNWRGDASMDVRWAQFFTSKGQIPVRVKREVFGSDEAILAVLAHELFEVQALRELFAASAGIMTATRLYGLVERGIVGNLHDQAWELADQLVDAMRRQS